MYLKKVELRNIKVIEALDMEFSEPVGWHVLLGDNGAGKSTILKAIAMGILGSREVLRLNPKWDTYVRKGQKDGRITVSLLREFDEKLPEKINRKNIQKIELALKNEDGKADVVKGKFEEGEGDYSPGKGLRWH